MAKIKANEKKMNSNSQIWTSGPRLDFGRYIAVYVNDAFHSPAAMTLTTFRPGILAQTCLPVAYYRGGAGRFCPPA